MQPPRLWLPFLRRQPRAEAVYGIHASEELTGPSQAIEEYAAILLAKVLCPPIRVLEESLHALGEAPSLDDREDSTSSWTSSEAGGA